MRKLYYLVVIVLCNVVLLFCGCNKKNDILTTSTIEEEPYYVKYYGTYVGWNVFNDIEIDQLEMCITITKLWDDMELYLIQGRDQAYNRALAEIDDMCGKNYDKEIHWGYAKVISINKSYVLMGYAPIYSNYKGSKPVLQSKRMYDVKNMCDEDKLANIQTMQVINDGLEKYNYTVEGNVITIKNNDWKSLCYTVDENGDIYYGILIDVDNNDDKYINCFDY